ncbi:MAG: hypothetical protein E7655_00535 [Ruminococcaceae bacterium]|nr:hypothetical protein [Oscillospiraceae bacterium]
MKKICLLLLSALLIALFTACSNTPSDISEGSETTTDAAPESEAVFTEPTAPLITEEEILRQTVVDYMKKMGTVEWTPEKTMDFSKAHSEKLIYTAGTTYRGMPYTNFRGGYEIFASALNKKGVYSGPVNYQKTYGNTCATSIKNAWMQVGNSFDFEFSIDMMPYYKDSGVLAIGDIPWEKYDEKNTTRSIVKHCDAATLYDAYAQMKPGDAFVRYLDTSGHAIMVTGEVKVFRGNNGTILPSRSTIVCTDQTGSFKTAKEGEPLSTWNIDIERSFEYLYQEGYLPVTIAELRDGKHEEPKLYIASEPTAELIAKTRTFRGAVNSNFKMASVTSTLTNKSGKILFTDISYPEGKVFSLSNLTETFKLKTMIPGTYTLNVKAVIGFGEFDVFDLTFTLN